MVGIASISVLDLLLQKGGSQTDRNNVN